MGIRIHKMLGYGLVDVKCDKNGIIADDRFNPDSVFNREERAEFNKSSYLAHCKKHNNGFEFDLIMEIMQLKKRSFHWAWYQSIVHDGEFGLPNVLCLTPACCPDWKQYDNTIDYYTAVLDAEKTDNYRASNVQVMDTGIFPWSDSFHDKRDGRRIDSSVACAFRRLVKSNKNFNSDPLAKVCGFESGAEALEFMVPKPPDIIVNLLAICLLMQSQYYRQSYRSAL